MALPRRNCIMESSRKTSQIVGKLLLVLALLLVGGAVYTQLTSSLLQMLVYRQDSRVQVLVLTKPAIQFTYNPATRKAVATLSATPCTAEKKESCFDGQFERFFIPANDDQAVFWSNFQDLLARWRFNPLLALKVAGGYLKMWFKHQTDISPAEFFVFAQHLATLDITDFATKLPTVQPKKKKAKNPPPAEVSADQLVAATEEDRPLVVEILNASGQKGIASALTQYLREQNTKGLLRVDVLQYDNYPTLQEKSSVVDYSGRLMQATQLSRAIGISGAIRSETSPTAICDTRIILGKDFQMPL